MAVSLPHTSSGPHLSSTWNISVNFALHTLKIYISTLLYVVNIILGFYLNQTALGSVNDFGSTVTFAETQSDMSESEWSVIYAPVNPSDKNA